ncbi:MAG: hypothetical protein P8M30_15920 [Planctomycetaceae bacterium]|jgi:hypothetical protein|nr:hypothetical protein [Planctomycetaceae bacterium]
MSSVSSARQFRFSSEGSGHEPTNTRDFVLEIMSGKTKFPNRPMPRGRLSIGASAKCWLQLGGPGIPEIHSWMEVGRKEVALYVFEEEPSIQVNGSKVQFALLKGGESLQIGTFEFQIHVNVTDEPDKPWLKPNLTPQQLENLKNELEKPLESSEKLTAEELVDLLEQEMHTIEQHDSRERAGLLRLMESVREAQEELDLEQVEKQTDEVILPIAHNRELESDDFVSRIEEVTRSLQNRTSTLQSEESGYARAAESLLRTQQRLIDQMDQLMSALDAQSSQTDAQSEEESQQALAG